MNSPTTRSSTSFPNPVDAEQHLPHIPQWISIPEGELTANGIIAVIPANNEEYGIGSVILQVRQHVDRVIIVDDGSIDHTAEIAKSAGAEVIRLDQKTGKTYALLLGLLRAREEKCTIAVVLNANGQYNPREIERLTG